MNWILLSFIIGPLLAASLVALTGRLKQLPETLAVLTTGYLLGTSAWLYTVRPYNNVLFSQLGLPLVLDGLSHLLLLLISAVAFLVILYALAYFTGKEDRAGFYLLYLLMVAGMNGVVLAGNLFHLFIALEIASLATYALVALKRGELELEAALKYLVLGSAASLFLLLGFVLLYGQTGTFFMAAISGQSIPGSIKMLIAALLIVGLGLKAALVPFHTWLPDAHTSAPAPVSATLSGILIKVLGIYCLVRLLFNVLGFTPLLSAVLIGLASLTILVGGLLALAQDDYKRLLAYSSVSQIGYIVLGLALGTPLGMLGALLHLFNHATFKPLLFLNAGAVERATGTRKLSELGGLRKKMPATSLAALFGSLAISGLPPFNGFWSKLFIILAALQAGQLWPALGAVIGSILTLAYFLKLQKEVFFGPLPEKLENIKEAGWLMAGVPVFLAVVCLVVGLITPLVIALLINPAVIAVMNGLGYGRMILGML
jgi:multicomponent Na+:H+ antiporter subunit D